MERRKECIIEERKVKWKKGRKACNGKKERRREGILNGKKERRKE